AHLSAQKDEYLQYLRETKRLGFEVTAHFKGHAYRLQGFGIRNIIDDGAILIGDAAGLAYPQSGEGIRPAVESGMLAAHTIIECNGSYSRDSLNRYQWLMDGHFGKSNQHHWWDAVPSNIRRFLARRLFRSRMLTRHILIDRWFLHSGQPPLKPLPVEAADVAPA
ncbi:MAG: NAD(P)/FAD-dependent oxidoreductase, partial [Planctomycetaceae bacterium]|nr:NAD(P)/FAD-dependent oxidoreductase [Planctomycetaceae bacterium]